MNPGSVRVAQRGAAVIIAIGGFLAGAALREICMTLLSWDEPRKRRARARSLHFWSRFLLKRLDFEVRCARSGGLERAGVLFVSNHLSFWDVVAIASQMSPVFVTSVEVRETPLLGLITRAAGCVFVERRDRLRKQEEREEVTQVLREGCSVMLFPEGTSTDGSLVRPFKKSFFTSAIAAGRPVAPLCINYLEVDGRRIDKGSRDHIFYYREQKFHVQLLRALRLRNAVISIEVLDELRTREGTTDREELVAQAHAAVSAHYLPVSLEPSP